MTKRIAALVAAMALAASGAPAFANEPVPTKVGQCVTTAVKAIGTRLQGVAGSGSAIIYSDGLSQVSYDTVPGIVASKTGDKVTLCLFMLPSNCPKGDDRGKIYKATNLRTKQNWLEADSEHSCGGA
ncbi:MAG TPA: hypothetical protein VHZ78_12990 [Rhizomicrobium sp.]|jgi:hypothetical protein|nr:hypothetical protein [Rhizomicrobium sp.]